MSKGSVCKLCRAFYIPGQENNMTSSAILKRELNDSSLRLNLANFSEILLEEFSRQDVQTYP